MNGQRFHQQKRTEMKTEQCERSLKQHIICFLLLMNRQVQVKSSSLGDMKLCGLIQKRDVMRKSVSPNLVSRCIKNAPAQKYSLWYKDFGKT